MERICYKLIWYWIRICGRYKIANEICCMRPQLLKVSKEPQHSFSVRQDILPYVNNRWHYHAEVELIHFKKGEGTQFIGDNIKRFKAGDVVLVGANLPHYWRFDDNYFEEGTPVAADIRVAHFCEISGAVNFCNYRKTFISKACWTKQKEVSR